ncbi:allantoate deiminase [Paenibacillus radicis (ex Gao et al. 2016)]|uniref:Allantoate amidohydrolase n=1 Tax=Paenibacillus radicis (ex Gao et al. 2016) TaxID=1737354 RepID=A0A917HIY3_9BACL|nr:allantoate deiminase [Paenibacillus radicis (ex Gao et al. 2016)]GGG79643.1 allantoate amidohydrolase [Paenibacillus radicis (ex Gao et al. 2016)]
MKQETAAFVSELLAELSEFGHDGSGGVTRLLYSEAWQNAQAYLSNRMKEQGLNVRVDRVGNLYGRLEGSNRNAPVVLTGSHIDSVVSGGRYDGTYGIAAGLAALAYLKETYGEPLHTLELVSFCEEEGSRFPLAYWGSGNATGIYEWDSGEGVYDSDGISLRQAMEGAGFGRADLPDCRRSDIGAFVELHIEQGPVLEKQRKRLGIVDAIVGQRRYAVTVQGEANHAGTTPMNMRKDALLGVSEMIMQLEADAIICGEPLVATVGRIDCAPNTPNVIPGSVGFTVDIRHSEEQLLQQFSESILDKFKEIAKWRGLEVSISPWLEAKSAPMHQALTDRLERISQDLSLTCRRISSGAGHDAQLFTAICPTAMLFVPSKAGISHSPLEYTSPEELADGVSVLAAFLYELAYEGKLP